MTAYVIITTAKNEEKNIESTIKSVLKQTIKPKEWIIVDDCSTDSTSEIVLRYSVEFSWIRLVSKKKYSGQIHGENIIEAFYFGLNSLKTKDFDYIANLDADIRLESSRYYEKLFDQFRSDSLMGIMSGITYYCYYGRQKIVYHPEYLTTGGMKVYSRKCFTMLDGPKKILGWDTLDDLRALSLGWKVRTDYSLFANHFGKLKDQLRRDNVLFYLQIGSALYRRGYSILFVLLKAIQIILSKRKVKAGLLFVSGYRVGKKAELPLVVSQAERKYINRFNLMKIINPAYLLNYYNSLFKPDIVRLEYDQYENHKRYIIITPCRNEQDVLVETIQSVLSQSILPVRWVIVDDGSTDNTALIINEYCEKHKWISYCNKDHVSEVFGSNIVEAFYSGYEKIESESYDYIVKLDADIHLDSPEYFEILIGYFNMNPNLGIASGLTYYFDNTGKRIVNHPFWRTTGAMKMYRKKCYDDIGGIMKIYGWDGIDDYMAMHKGWLTRTFNDLEVRHLKKYRSIDRQNSIEVLRSKGKSYYVRGYSLPYIALYSIKYIVVGRIFDGFHIFSGYIANKNKKVEQVVSPSLKTFIRRFNRKRIFLHFRKLPQYD